MSTDLGEPWSIIQPNSSGPMMPPMLKPVETMPNTRPMRARRRGPPHQHVARRLDHAENDAGEAHGEDERRHRQREGGDEQHDRRRQAEADGRHVAVAPGLVGQRPARQHAHRGARKVGRERDIGRREGDPMGGDEGDHGEAVDGAVGEREQGEERGQAQHGRREDAADPCAACGGSGAGGPGAMCRRLRGLGIRNRTAAVASPKSPTNTSAVSRPP